eukprot:832475-Prymnesium_polylepis.1
MESRGICVRVHCRHGVDLRQLSGCSASPLSNIQSAAAVGWLKLSGVGLALAAAPDASLSRRCAVTAA